jgi:hypothetical protein
MGARLSSPWRIGEQDAVGRCILGIAMKGARLRTLVVLSIALPLVGAASAVAQPPASPSPDETGASTEPETEAATEAPGAGAPASPDEPATPPSELATPPAAGAPREGAPTEAPSPGAPAEEPSLLDTSTFMVSMAFFLGPAQGTGFDQALRGFGYGEAPRFWGGELDVEWRALGFLWVGARADLRTRQWARTGHDDATALGLSGLALADARVNLGRRVDLSFTAGLGFGAMLLELNGVTNAHGIPRAHAGIKFGWTMFQPMRMFVRVAVDYAESLPVNELDHTVSFSIVSLGIGVEARQ